MIRFWNFKFIYFKKLRISDYSDILSQKYLAYVLKLIAMYVKEQIESFLEPVCHVIHVIIIH